MFKLVVLLSVLAVAVAKPSVPVAPVAAVPYVAPVTYAETLPAVYPVDTYHSPISTYHAPISTYASALPVASYTPYTSAYASGAAFVKSYATAYSPYAYYHH